MQKLFTLLVALATALTLFSQGCSDAGFCTVGPLKNADSDTTQNTTFNQLKTGLSVGRADYNITAIASFLEYSRQFGKYWSASAKLTQLAQSGNGISVNGLSDVFLTGVYNPRKLTYTLGIKVPLTDGNRSYNGKPLPLDYQSSLGTLDLIAGISRKWSNFRLTAAIQQPLAHNNNRFFPDAFDSASVLSGIPATNGFQRKGDVLLRATYDIAVGKLETDPGPAARLPPRRRHVPRCLWKPRNDPGFIRPDTQRNALHTVRLQRAPQARGQLRHAVRRPHRTSRRSHPQIRFRHRIPPSFLASGKHPVSHQQLWPRTNASGLHCVAPGWGIIEVETR